MQATCPTTTQSIFVIPRPRAACNPDKFVWNEFEQPKAGPKGKVQGRTLESILILALLLNRKMDSGFRRNDDKAWSLIPLSFFTDTR